MSKAPAFQFYPGDFVSGSVGLMTPEEVGVYTLLLCLDWNQTGFVYDVQKLARWCRTTPKRFATVWETVGPNFTKSDGRFYHPRLQQERLDQAANREKKKSAANARWHPDALPEQCISNAGALHLECPSPSPSSSSSDVVVIGGVTSDAAIAEQHAPSTPTEIAVLLTTAANQGITARYGEQPHPLRFSHPGSAECVESVSARGVPVMFARDAFYNVAKACTLKRPPSSLKYFLNQVLGLWEDVESKRLAAQSPTPNAIPVTSGDRKVVSLAANRARMLGGTP